MIKFFYDLLVFLTKNYSSMSDDFRKLFPEERLVNARQVCWDMFNSDETDFADYEKQANHRKT